MTRRILSSGNAKAFSNLQLLAIHLLDCLQYDGK